jgi:uncharacterized protein with PIN domain
MQKLLNFLNTHGTFKKEMRYCEICGREMGVMLFGAYEARHKHCDFCTCPKCEAYALGI